MTKKKKLLCAAALCLLAVVLFFAEGLFGNPVSSLLARRTAQAHLQANWPDRQLAITRHAYNFKDGCYHSFVESKSSIDTHFSICCDRLGRLRYDTYEDVTGGWNTQQRINNGYNALVETVLEAEEFPYTAHISFGELKAIDQTSGFEPPDWPAYGFVTEELELDREYDLRQMGAQYGHIVLYLWEEEETVSFERAAALLLDIRSRMDAAQVPFYAIDFVLGYPRLAEGETPRPDQDAEVRVSDFLYADICEEGLAGRLEQAHNTLAQWYAVLDAKALEAGSVHTAYSQIAG